MVARTIPQRLGRVLERMTQQSGRLSETPAYGSYLLGRVNESPSRRRVRIQTILTVVIVGANLVGVAVAVLLVTVAFPVPSVFTDAPKWVTFGVVPAYIAGGRVGRHVLDHPTDGERPALGDRGPRPKPGR